jgi:peptide methionine sulfoxide reductase MsrA
MHNAYIYVHTNLQAALASKAKYEASGVFGGRPLVTEITQYKQFWPAEDYHQVCIIDRVMLILRCCTTV